MNFLLTSGLGTHSSEELVAFDAALLNAGIADHNLVKISSILPPHATEGIVVTSPKGSPLLTAYATISSSVPGTILATAVAVGLPKNPDDIGIIMELSTSVRKLYDSNSTDAAVIECRTGLENRIKRMVEDAMKNHRIEMADLKLSSIATKIPFHITDDSKRAVSLVSALCLW